MPTALWRSLTRLATPLALLSIALFGCDDSGNSNVDPGAGGAAGEVGAGGMAGAGAVGGGEAGAGGQMCTPGSLNCACDAGACDGALQCVADTCLEVVDEMCGRLGCACDDDMNCDEGVCIDGTCAPDPCPAGTEGCACDRDRCVDPLVCQNNVCSQPAVEGGEAGAACLEGDICQPGNRCQNGICLPCRAGSQSCVCKDDGTCNAGLSCDALNSCVSGLSELGLVAECTTPCTRGIEQPDGSFVACPADGLVAGCFGSTACVDGQCLVEGDAAQTCVTDIDCPEHQACLVGEGNTRRCASNCATDDHCAEGAECYRRVCRIPCDIDAPVCPHETICDPLDGENGFCMPLPPVEGVQPEEPTVTYSISVQGLDLSGGSAQSFTLTNTGEGNVRLTIVKARHIVDSVTTSLVPANGDPLAVADCGDACPMPWLEIGDGDSYRTSFRYIVQLEPGASTEIFLRMAAGSDVTRWTGSLEIHQADADVKEVTLAYASEPAGWWEGNMYTFGDFKADGVDAWMANRGNQDVLQNALVKFWAQFRAGTITEEEFTGALVAAREESWQGAQIEALCGAGNVCFPYDNRNGYLVFSNNPDVEVPSGVVPKSIAMVLRSGDAATQLVGKIDSAYTLHYAGDPEVTLEFEGNPALCDGEGCKTYLSNLDAQVVVGGRYGPGDGACGAGFERADTPWLPVGFFGDSVLVGGERTVASCRDGEAPFGDDPDASSNLARANPIPDGRRRIRSLELIDGFLFERTQLYILFRERTRVQGSDIDDLVAYGYMILRRDSTNLEPEDSRGNAPLDAGQAPDRSSEAICPDEILSALGYGRAQVEAAGARNDGGTFDALASSILGAPPGGGGNLPEVRFPEVPHYFCEETGYFDGGVDDDGSVDALPAECPDGSQIIYFTLRADVVDAAHDEAAHQAWIAGLECQQDGSCAEVLEIWEAEGRFGFARDPFWTCTDGSHPTLCSANRRDLLEGKTFYADLDLAWPSFRTSVASAFRYRTRFSNRDGTALGFAPEICEGIGSNNTYCYDPTVIEELGDRGLCAVEVYGRFGDLLSEDVRSDMQRYLEEHFGYREERDQFNEVSIIRGFEALAAELLIMLGDDAYTLALTSRFDLAGARVNSFPGDRIETDGIRLSGIPGAEMYNLYKAVQLYQLTLDRFYTMKPAIEANLAAAVVPEAPRPFITTRTLTTYIDRLIRASTQKAKAYSEIATRYQSFNRGDLAQRVIEREYTATYLEASLLNHLMNTLVEVAERADRDQIRIQIRNAQISYRAALDDMREVYESLSSGLTYFGYAPEYVPFPALEFGRDNPFEVALQRAKDRLAIAQQAELLAIDADRTFNTDQANFENELTRIANQYESRLLEMCGAIEVEGRVYPAIKEYAELTDETALLGDPCGQTGTGAIVDALGEVQLAMLEVDKVKTASRNVLREVAIEVERAQAMCDEVEGLSTFVWDKEGEALRLEREVQIIENNIQRMDRISGVVQSIFSNLASCPTLSKLACIGINVGVAAAAATSEGLRINPEISVLDKREKIAKLQRDIGQRQHQHECTNVQIDSEANIERTMLRMAELDLETTQAMWRVQQATLRVDQQRLVASRLQQELAETLALQINVEATRNNPNVRIYRNDAVINADLTFDSAIRNVYIATKVLEYYTSSSYGALDELFLARMASRGDYNLSNYMLELEDAFRDFEDVYGLPDTRVLRVSLKDEIFGIAYTDAEGRSLGSDERNTEFTSKLTDRTLLDDNGYIVIPFSTAREQLSPLTRNHQIKYVSAQVTGNNLGDIFTRVYLRMAGTGTIVPLGADDTPVSYLFAPRTGVIDAFQSEKRSTLLDNDEFYRSRTLASRPVINSQWELIINMVDEPANADFRIEDLTDVRLYFYYSDFVEF